MYDQYIPHCRYIITQYNPSKITVLFNHPSPKVKYIMRYTSPLMMGAIILFFGSRFMQKFALRIYVNKNSFVMKRPCLMVIPVHNHEAVDSVFPHSIKVATDLSNITTRSE